MESTRIWVLGASDPEMTEIESVLAANDETYVYARNDRGDRVTPRQASRARLPPLDQDPSITTAPTFDQAILVECVVPIFLSLAGKLDVVDHHTPGDPGFGMPPERYLEGSSLGQVLTILGINPTPEQRCIAAADHCLAAAYAGRCPDVDPKELRKVRSNLRGEWLRKLPEEREERRAAVKTQREFWTLSWASSVRLLQTRTMAHLREQTPTIVLGGVPIYDLRKSDVLPELPEALAIMGKAAIYIRDDRGKKKIGIIGGGDGSNPGTSPIRTFLEAAQDGEVLGTHVEGAYGDPVRGYAGAYILNP